MGLTLALSLIDTNWLMWQLCVCVWVGGWGVLFQFSALTTSVSVIAQQLPTEVIICFPLTSSVSWFDGIAYDTQYPRQAFDVNSKLMQPGMSIFWVWPCHGKETRIESLVLGCWSDENDNLPTMWQPFCSQTEPEQQWEISTNVTIITKLDQHWWWLLDHREYSNHADRCWWSILLLFVDWFDRVLVLDSARKANKK